MRAVSVTELYNTEFEHYDLSDEFKAAFGSPEKNGVWFLWGNSANGKTSFAIQLAKELSRFGKVLYNSLEEGSTGTMKKAFKVAKMEEVKHRILLASESVDDMIIRLRKQKSPEIVFIDSLQYAQITFKKFTKLKEEFGSRKLLVFVSQAEGKQPRGNTAVSLLYAANLKIWVEGYTAYSRGRTIGEDGSFTIWKEGAEKFGSE